MESAPGASANLSSAQRQVLIAVKRRGEASADDVAEILGITPSAVRQHLATLRTGGLRRLPPRAGPTRAAGRPLPQHRTGRVPVFAGPTAGDLSVELLGHIEDEDPELVPRVFERRRRRRVEQCRETARRQASGRQGGRPGRDPRRRGIHGRRRQASPTTVTDLPSTAAPSGRSPPATAWLAPPNSSSYGKSSPTPTSPGSPTRSRAPTSAPTRSGRVRSAANPSTKSFAAT